MRNCTDYPDFRHQPQIFLKRITFNDGTSLDLNPQDIIVLTGPNNGGKSQTLRDIANSLNCVHFKDPVVLLQKPEFEYVGDFDEEFLASRYVKQPNGTYSTSPYGGNYTASSLISEWNRQELSEPVLSLFLTRLATDKRLTGANTLTRTPDNKYSKLARLFKNEKMANDISAYFHQAFGLDLVLDNEEFDTISLRTGHLSNEEKDARGHLDEYGRLLAHGPTIQEQGDGMRAFASILLGVFCFGTTMTLIDEPEAFLHPPQAHILGRLLADHLAPDKQLVIATHSRSLLLGLLSANTKNNVAVLRIERVGEKNGVSILNSDDIHGIWSNPILRYSNILSGLFYEKVVVCESDYDCLFYQALTDAMYDREGEKSPSMLFTHCGGKGRLKTVVRALKALNVPTVAISDFDLVDDKREYKKLLNSFGFNGDSLNSHFDTIYNYINAQNTSKMHELFKTAGKASLSHAAYAAYESIEETSRELGLFVVPCGELESFDKGINKDKREWVEEVLDQRNLATDTELDDARAFVRSIVEFQPAHNSESN